MIKEFSGNFSSITEFDKSSANVLKEFFDIDFVARNYDEYQQYFQNLKNLAYQNLGLAHCVVHNQSAQNVIQTAFDLTKFDCYQRPYGNHVGAYSFKKPPRSETLRLDGKHIKGTKSWVSQLHNADFVILRMGDTEHQHRWVYIDLEQAPQQIINLRDNMLGMDAAKPADMEIDIELPDQWVLDRYVPVSKLDWVNNFHDYGLVTNYVSNARALLDSAESLSQQHGLNVDYNIKSLDLQVRVLESLWTINMPSVMQDLSPEFWKTRYTQYQFSKKTLIDIIHLCLQIFNSTMLFNQGSENQTFRDSLLFSSHIATLYSNLESGTNY